MTINKNKRRKQKVVTTMTITKIREENKSCNHYDNNKNKIRKHKVVTTIKRTKIREENIKL